VQGRTAQDFLLLGRVGRPHGLKGAFFVVGREEPIPLELGEVLIGSSPEAARCAKIVASRLQNQRPLFVCSLAVDRDASEALLGQSIYVSRQRYEAVCEPDLLWSDLVGVTVVDKDGCLLGRIRELYNAGASDVAVIQDEQERSFDLPLAPDYVDLDRELEQMDGVRRLTLLVAAEVFEGLWQDGRSLAKPSPPEG